ncbi:hypothetical protein NOR_08236 [Metarhizium rileyi]|uniref:DUF3106 domain-containing protein n=1 Tax=Metarhizium rileyi (strain RCEF 4871) TaxID=1649241 RepID=A0A166WL47_METRR|nr:hypothetical protein NOR_08236 [Metarhizium rileyi RCEF 4871]
MRVIWAATLSLCLEGLAAPVSHMKRVGPEGPMYEVEGSRPLWTITESPELELLSDEEREPLLNPEKVEVQPSQDVATELTQNNNDNNDKLEVLPLEGNAPDGDIPASSSSGPEGPPPPPESGGRLPESSSPWKGKSHEDIKKEWLALSPEKRAENRAIDPVHKIWDSLSHDERFFLVLENPKAKDWPNLTPEQRLYLWTEKPIVTSKEAQKLWALLTPKQRDTNWTQDPKNWRNLTPAQQEEVVTSVQKNSIYQGLDREEIRTILKEIDSYPPNTRNRIMNERLERKKAKAVEELAERARQNARNANAVVMAKANTANAKARILKYLTNSPATVRMNQIPKV